MTKGRGLSPAVASLGALLLAVGCTTGSSTAEGDVAPTTTVEASSTPPSAPTTLEPLAVETTLPAPETPLVPVFTMLSEGVDPDPTWPPALNDDDERALVFRHQSTESDSETGPTTELELDLLQHFDDGDDDAAAGVVTTVEAARLDGSERGLETLTGVWLTRERVDGTWSSLQGSVSTELTDLASSVIGPVRETFDDFGHLYPTEPVGVGSTWQVSDSNDVSGLPALAVTTVTVIAIGDGQLDATFERVISFEAGPIQLENTFGTLLDTTESRTSGIISWRDGFPLPLLSLETVTEFNVEVDDGSLLTTIINQRQEVAVR